MAVRLATYDELAEVLAGGVTQEYADEHLLGQTVSGSPGTDKTWVRDGSGAMVWTEITKRSVFDAHTARTDNPHGLTASQIGLGSVNNTTDADKPISTATQTALDAKAAATALTTHTGRTDNPHSVTKGQVGLGSVDNTADSAKPVSTAQAAALAGKQDAATAATDAELAAHTSRTDNPHAVTKSQVGLGAVDNTSDALKPLSDAAVAALAAKLDADDARLGTQVVHLSSYLTAAQIAGTDPCAAEWLEANNDVFAMGGSRRLVIDAVVFLETPAPMVAADVPALPPNLGDDELITFEFAPGARIVCSNNYPGPAWTWGRTADYQVFRRFRWIRPWFDGDDLSLDGSGNPMFHDIIVGPTIYGSTGARAQRNSYEDILIDEPRITNMMATGQSAGRKGIYFFSRHLHTNEGDANWNPHAGEQTFCTDILVRRPMFDGVDSGILAIAQNQFGSTGGLRIKNFAGSPTVINYVGRDLAKSAPLVNEWIDIGAALWFERHKITAVTDNGDGTGSITLATTLANAQPTEDANGANNGAPMAMGDTVNHWIDRVVIDGQGGHIKGGTGSYGSLIGLGSGGIGDFTLVRDILLDGSGDNLLEQNAILNCQTDNVIGRNGKNEAFLDKNWNVPQDRANNWRIAEQVHVHRDSVHIIEGEDPTVGVPHHGWVPGYSWRPGVGSQKPGPSAPFGTVRIVRGRYIDRSPKLKAIPGQALRCGPDATIRRLEADITVIKENMNDATPETGGPKFCYVWPAGRSVVKLDIKSRLGGTATGATPIRVLDVGSTPFGTAQGDILLDALVGCFSSLQGVANTGHQLVNIGDWAGANLGVIHGRIGVYSPELWTSSDVQPKLLRWGDNCSIYGGMIVHQTDCALFPPAARIHTFQGTLPRAYQRRIKHSRDNNLKGVFSNMTDGSGQTLTEGIGFGEYDLPGATGMVTTSPWTWMNETTVDVRVVVSGGTVSAIDFNNGTAFNNGKLTGVNVFTLRPGEGIRITHTGAPTLFIFPMI